LNVEAANSGPVVVDAERLRGLAAAILEAAGFRPDDATLVAEVLVEADLRGVDSHGVTRLAGYVSMIDSDLLNPRPDVKLLRESGSTVLIDGDRGIGIIAARQAIDRVIELSGETGIACASVRNISHTGMIGWYTMRAAEAGRVGIAMNNGPSMVPPFGGRAPLTATNPISIAAPAEPGNPLVLDMATTMVAAGKLRLATKTLDSIPDQWALDRQGRPTSDPVEAIQHGFLQWAGGYKGYGLALMIEVLAGVLSGSRFGTDVPTMIEFGRDPLESSGFYIAIDIERFMPLDEFRQRVEQLIDQAHRIPAADESQPVKVAGQLEAECRRQRLADGIPVRRAVFEELAKLGERFGVPVRLE